MVHALSEYAAKFADVVTPLPEDTGVDVGMVVPLPEDTGVDVGMVVPLPEGTGVDVGMAGKVVSAKAIPIMTNATTATVTDSFSFAVSLLPHKHLYSKM
jgi:hypothetical protein